MGVIVQPWAPTVKPLLQEQQQDLLLQGMEAETLALCVTMRS